MDSHTCSPRKMRKVEKPEHFSRRSTDPGNEAKYSQESQETRATSTPTRANRDQDLDWESVSTIAALARAESRRSSSSTNINSENSEMDAVSSAMNDFNISGSNRSVDTMVDLLQKSKIKPQMFRGKVWNYLKPKNEGSLYHQIITNFDDISACAKELVNELHSNPKEATVAFIKFLINLCGYQSAEIEKYLDFEGDFRKSSENLIKMMKGKLLTESTIVANTTIFLEAENPKSKLGATLSAAVTLFIEEFYNTSYKEDLLFSNAFAKQIFTVIYYMCQNPFKVIIHTGLVLVRITLRALNFYYGRLLMEIETNHSTSDSYLEREKGYLEKYLHYFFSLFASEKLALYPYLNNCIVKNMENLSAWMLDIPDLYFERGLRYLLKFMVLESPVLRAGAIETSKCMLEKKNPFVRKHIRDLLSVVSGRIIDINFKVKIKAIEFLTLALNRYPAFIHKETCATMIQIACGKYYQVARSAGHFLHKYYEGDKEMFLNFIVEASTIPAMKELKPSFVESFSEIDTVLKDYEFLFQTLIDRTEIEDLEFARNLIELVYYSAHQNIRGCSFLERAGSVQTGKSLIHQEAISKVMFSKFQELFNIYRIDSAVYDYITKIFCLIDYESLVSSNRVHYTLLLKRYRLLFLSETDADHLRTICTLFHHFCEQQTTAKDEATKFLQQFFEKICTFLRNYQETDDGEVDIKSHFLRIGIISEKFNLNKYLDWNAVFLTWKDVPPCEGQMITCNQFLFWKTSELAENPEIGAIHYLKAYFKEYADALIQTINDAETEDVMLKCKVFEHLCMLHYSCNKVMKSKPELAELRSVLLDNFRKFFPKPLEEFFNEKILNNNLLPVEMRKNLILKWLDIVFSGVVDIAHLIPLFQCYSSHPEYARLIERTCQHCFESDKHSFYLLISLSLCMIYKDISIADNKKSDSGPTATDVMKLAAKFAALPECSDSLELSTMFGNCFNFAFGDKCHVEFLAVLQHFMKKLNYKHADDCLEKFIQHTPAWLEKHSYVVSFRTKLKIHQTTARKRANASVLSNTSVAAAGTEPPKEKEGPVATKGAIKKKTATGPVEQPENGSAGMTGTMRKKKGKKLQKKEIKKKLFDSDAENIDTETFESSYKKTSKSQN